MSKRTMLIVATCTASAMLLVGCPGTQKSEPRVGNYVPGAIADAELVLYLKADGTLLRVDGLRGGTFEKESKVAGEPHGLGQKLADITIYKHNGSLEDLKIEDGTTDGKSAHLHSGVVTPPWNTHCHLYVQQGTTYVISHCP